MKKTPQTMIGVVVATIVLSSCSPSLCPTNAKGYNDGSHLKGTQCVSDKAVTPNF